MMKRNTTKHILFAYACVAPHLPTVLASFATHHRYNCRYRHTSKYAESSEDEPAGIGVGIDLGTTNSAAAILKDGIPTMIPFDVDATTIPSVVCLISDQQQKDSRKTVLSEIIGDGVNVDVLVGREAIDAHLARLEELERDRSGKKATSSQQKYADLRNYRNVKRVMGVGCTTAATNSYGVVPNLSLRASVQDDASIGKRKKKKLEHLSLPKQVEEASTNPAMLKFMDDLILSPEQISAVILRKLFDQVEEHVGNGEKVTRAVVGVPAYFNDRQRDATKRACELAGVPKVKLLREPEAAALAYGVGKDQAARKRGDEMDMDDELVLVFDLGGGTFDVSVLAVGGGIMEVVATGGNNMLGGSDFDARVAEFFAKQMTQRGARNYMKRAKGSSAENDKVASAMINSAEAVRVFLSNNKAVTLAIPLTAENWLNMPQAEDVIIKSEANLKSYRESSSYAVCQLSRKQMEDLCDQELQNLLRPIRETALLARAMLPGDARPSVVENAIMLEEEYQDSISSDGIAFDDFYDEDGGSVEVINVQEDDPMLLAALQAMDAKSLKKQQQKGRKNARSLAGKEKSYRKEKRNAAENSKVKGLGDSNVKVRDGFGGRPINQVVLVGGATRMPAVGRLLATITGAVPQRTVNPDEAVALGCAVQVGLLDGNEAVSGVLEVMTPMQAAIMRAMAEKRGLTEAALEGMSDIDDI